ncbi:peroxiredoxin-like family protein [Ferruginibacter yonginensis]|uniref:thioredoxin-dependent peroxiredoxin n=1 Tax=Ferruginibacter yonginensis TaxID=1310416 RepID=A0ABV8QS25_9BACT
MKKSILFLLLSVITLSSMAQANIAYPSGLSVGEKAPMFAAKDQNGNMVDVQSLLKKGPVVVIFYRGQWCPYCNQQLKKVSDSLSFITAKGASVVTVTPESAVNISKTIEKTKATYAIIEDKGLSIMKSYKVNFLVDDNTVTKYKGYGVDFATVNGDNGANLPVPATYIIAKDGTIKYRFFNTDYRARASVNDIINHL